MLIKTVRWASENGFDFSSKVTEESYQIIIESLFQKSNFPNDVNQHIKKNDQSYSWTFNRPDMIIIELEKYVVLDTKEGVRRFGLKFNKVN